MPQQQTFQVTAPDGKTTLEITGDRVPTAAELQEIFKASGVNVPAAPVSTQLETPVQSRAEAAGMPPIVDVGVGAVKGAAKTAVGVGELVSNIPGVSHALDAVYGPEVRKGSFDWARSFLKPTNTAQAIGQGAEQVGEFFMPAAKLGHIKTALKTGSGLLNAIAGMGVEGVSAAAVDAAQKGHLNDVMKTGALTAGVGLGVQGGLKGAQVPAKWLGERIESALLKPMPVSLEGATPKQMVQTMFKHDLGGTLGQSFDKVTAKIREKSAQLKAALTADPSAVVDLKALRDTTVNDFTGNQQAIKAMDRIREAVEFGLNERGVKLKNGVLDLADATTAKQAVGELGAWLHDVTGKTTSDADRVLEKVANRFYGHLKRAIEAQAKGDVAAINKEIGELIPIRHAIIRRIPIAERASVLNATDIVGGAAAVIDPSALGLSIAGRLLKSGRVANVAQKAGTADTTTAATTAARLTGVAQ